MTTPTHAITAIAPSIAATSGESLRALLDQHSVQVVGTRQHPVVRSLEGRRAAQTLFLKGDVTGNFDAQAVRHALDSLAEQVNEDFVLQTMATRQRDYRLAVFDMDSTLIQCEVIDELAKRAGVGAEVAAITERAMRGELDFKASFTERLAMLKGLSESVLAEIAAELPITEGMPELILTLRARGIRTAILSGGFNYFAEHLRSRYGFDEIHANHLDIVDGRVTGRVTTEIVDGARKRALLLSIASEQGIEPAQVIAVGDGANDLPMLAEAGLGVAFEAKPVVRAQAAHNLRHVGLDGVLYLLGSASEADPEG